MREKQNLGRFTIQFNMNDPVQANAAEILEKQGRRKAQFLANAISYYRSCYKSQDQEQSIFMASRSVAESQAERQADDGPTPIEARDPDYLDAIFEGQELSAISQTLSAFSNL